MKWAFGFPGGTQAYGNPTIVAGRVFVGSDNGTVYALDAESGCIQWSFKAEGGVRSAPTVGAIGRRYAVYLGDMKANVFAVDASSGELIWRQKMDEHKFARVTGAPTLVGGRLYVPVSSVEEAPAAQPSYECCTFRGSVVAVDAATGSQIWKSYTITETPQQVGKNAAGHGTLRAGRRRRVECADGRRTSWRPVHRDRQFVHGSGGQDERLGDRHGSQDRPDRLVEPGDVSGCLPRRLPSGGTNENCPKELGPDFDFGNAPILRTLPGGKRILVIGQKSGTVWGFDPDNEGKVVWKVQAGKGGALGGIEWGSAADDEAAVHPGVRRARRAE